MRHVVLLCCVVWFPMILVAQIQQNTIKIIDIETNEPLIGALVEGDCFNGISDESGIVTVNGKPCAITVSYIGYAAATWTPIDDNVWPAVISLKLNNQVIDFVTVTTSRYDQSLSRANVSIDIIKPSLLRSVNATSSDNILNKLPGVQVLDGQANIRGGSGYSYGAGSRVMLLINDMPALQPDAGFSNWSDIPIESLSQIEVVKGAGSALYGSAALNGIINFRSDYATLEPLTRISSGFMSYMTPKDVDKKWWQDTLVYEANFSFLHKQKSGKLDWIVSLFHNRQRSFNQFTSQNRYRGNVSLNYRWTDRLTVALQTIVNTNENSSYFLWRNGASGAMQPFDGTVTERQSLRVYIDPVLTYFDKYDNRHKFLNRSIYIDNNNDNNQDNSSWNQYTEYQFQRNMLDDKLILSLGAVGQWSTVNSQILGDTTFKASTYASYGQIDYNISSKWQVSGGIR